MYDIPRNFLKPQVEHFIEIGNFSEREEELLRLITDKKRPTLERCAEILGVSVSTVNRDKRKIVKKIEGMI